MTLTGLSYSTLRYSPRLPAIGLEPCKRTYYASSGRSKDLICLKGNGLISSTWRHKQRIVPFICETGAAFGDTASNDSTVTFPRISVKDPYKRLGVSREASEDEIQAARNFLMQTYGHHKPSVDAIESAHDKIIMQKFYERKNPKINIKKKVREVSQSRYVQAVTSRFRIPATKSIIKTSIAFLVLGVFTVFFPTEEGPTLQVAISLMVTMYFIYERLKSKLQAFLYGVGSFIISWLVGTFLTVSVMPPIFNGLRSLEVTTSLLSYFILRTVVSIPKHPSALAVKAAAWGLARYAAISADNGLVPIDEPGILLDGEHGIDTTFEVAQKVWAEVFFYLAENNVTFEGILLKPNMVTPGAESKDKATPEQVAEYTLNLLKRRIPPAVPGIMFLSGGQSELEATLNLNAMNQAPNPCHVSFSYARALQNTTLETWGGRPENVKAAQEALLTRASANSLAQLGKYRGEGECEEAKKELFVKGYSY